MASRPASSAHPPVRSAPLHLDTAAVAVSGRPDNRRHEVREGRVDDAQPRPGHRADSMIPPGGGVHDDALRKITQLEEMVARTHERAAELYEKWLEQRSDTATGTLRSRARRHREMASEVRSVRRLAVQSLRGLEMRVAAGVSVPGKARHLAVLGALEHLRDLLDRRIEEVVAAGREEGASWAEIASALRVTRQTAHERYRQRPARLSGDPDGAVRPTGRA